jgi:Tol biopolymer transport system component
LTPERAIREHRSRVAFPGANGLIAFASKRTGRYELFTMTPEGRDVRQLTDGPGDDIAPNWSPDGTKIVFTSTRDGSREIYVMDADGGDQTRLTDDPAADHRPDWSPDGTAIVFASERGAGRARARGGLVRRQIFVMDSDGGNLRRLTRNDELDNAPHFSPDGSRIAFLRVQENGHMAVYTIAADGSDERKLTPDELNGAEPDWSPDGTLLAIQNNTCPLPECEVPSDILVLDAGGGRVRRLTNDFGALSPRWSPDGARIAFIRTMTVEPPYVFDIYTMAADGTEIRNLTDNREVDDSFPAWGSG